jgi:cGMP-dependent protein kinase
VTSAKVWALDRRVFQQVMKKTGLQRIDDNLKFLRSVPLFERLTTDHMSKIADVLEVVSIFSLIPPPLFYTFLRQQDI